MIDCLERMMTLKIGTEETWSTPLLLPELGLIVAVSRDNLITAFDMRGRTVWQRRLGDVVTASPTCSRLDDGSLLVCIGTHAGAFYALEAATGETRWRRSLGAIIRASASFARPQPGGELCVYIASYGDHLWCLRARDGTARWKRWLPHQIWPRAHGVVSSPMVADVDEDGRLEVVIGTRSFRVFCLDALDGALRWFQGFDYGVDSICTPANAGGVPVIIVDTGETTDGEGDRAIVAIRGTDGGEHWRFDADGGIDSSAVVADLPGIGQVVLATSLRNATLFCLRLRDGSELWRYAIGAQARCTHDAENMCIPWGKPHYFTEWATCRSYTTPLCSDLDDDGQLEVLFGSNNGQVYLLDARSGREKARLQTEGIVRGSPVAADLDGDGRAELVIPAGNKIHVFRTPARDVNWPMLKGPCAGLWGRSDAHTPLVPEARSHCAKSRRVRRISQQLRLANQFVVRDAAYYGMVQLNQRLLRPLGIERPGYKY